MKMIVVAFAFVALAVAAPVDETKQIEIIKSSYENNPDGSYNFGFETENGITRNEEGQLKEALDEENKPHTVVVARGTYAYTDPEGNPQAITYFADETGFHADGPSIPKAPVSRR